MRYATEQALRDALAGKGKAPKPAKHKAEPTVLGGIRFASKAEAHRYSELKLLQRAGRIAELELQPVFVLAPAVVLDGRKKPAIRYLGDFRYRDTSTGELVIEDVKGMVTPMYRLKRHLLKVVHGIEIKEIKR